MIEIKKHNPKLVAIYSPESGTYWLQDKLNKGENHYLKNTYRLSKDKILDLHEIDEDLDEEENIAFQIGVERNNYFALDKEIFGIDIDIYIEKSIHITPNFFTANKNISIISKLEDVVKEQIYLVSDENYNVNEDNTNKIPLSAYKNLLTNFPNNTELIKYSHMRIATALSEYFDNVDIYKTKYENYLNKKNSSSTNNKFSKNISLLKLNMLTSSQEELTKMLKTYKSFNEKAWQNKIKNILCVLFPKYLYAIREVNFGEIHGYDKHPDFTLIDSNGYIDIMEIKKPEDAQIIRNCKNRNNYVPQKIFTDVVVQTTKYINALNQNHDKSKINIIKKLKEDHPDTTLSTSDIFINNPKGLILLGRSNKLTKEQKDDFELIRRQYKDIVEIMTYDDLLNRINNLVEKLKQDVEV